MREFIQIRKAKIDDLQIIGSLLQEQIFRLEVTMTDSVLVEIFDSIKYLFKEFGSSDIINSLMSHDVIKELSSIDMLHN